MGCNTFYILFAFQCFFLFKITMRNALNPFSKGDHVYFVNGFKHSHLFEVCLSSLNLDLHTLILILPIFLSLWQQYHCLLGSFSTFILPGYVSNNLIIFHTWLIVKFPISIEQYHASIPEIDLNNIGTQSKKVHFVLLYPFFDVDRWVLIFLR